MYKRKTKRMNKKSHHRIQKPFNMVGCSKTRKRKRNIHKNKKICPICGINCNCGKKCKCQYSCRQECYIHRKEKKSSKTCTCRFCNNSKKTNSYNGKGGFSFIPQDLVNLGRGFEYQINDLYNTSRGVEAPVNPLPFKDQLTGALNINRF